MKKYPELITVLFLATLAITACSEPTTMHPRVTDSAGAAFQKSMEDFQNRPIYNFLTDTQIDTTKDDDLVLRVTDQLSTTFNADGNDYTTVTSWNEGQQAMYIIGLLEAEVNNGGFNQFYYNSSGQYAKLLPDALKLIGANNYAELMERANMIFEKENRVIKKHQDGTTEGFSKSYENNPLNLLDDEFYALEKKEDLMKMQVSFIRKNKSLFTKK
jgi:hypothetical protein